MYVPHTAGRYAVRRFRKAQVSIFLRSALIPSARGGEGKKIQPKQQNAAVAVEPAACFTIEEVGEGGQQRRGGAVCVI